MQHIFMLVEWSSIEREMNNSKERGKSCYICETVRGDEIQSPVERVCQGLSHSFNVSTKLIL